MINKIRTRTNRAALATFLGLFLTEQNRKPHLIPPGHTFHRQEGRELARGTEREREGEEARQR